DYSATHSGGSLSTGGPVGKDLLTNMAGGSLSAANNSGHAEGTTKAGVSEGTLIVRDTDKQQQDVAQLNRDTEHANDGSISPIFNKEKEQKRLKQAQLIGEIGGQAMDVIRTQGEIAGLKAQKDPAALAQAREQLEQGGKPFREADVLQRAYDNAMRQYGTGSDLQKAAQAVTGALTALAGNNLAGALASGASPYLATEIKERVGEDNIVANAMAHAVLGAVTAQLNNQSAAAGGLGAGGGELTARYIAGQLFPGKTAQQLSESEKQQVSALSQLAAGLAGGLATGDTAGAVTGGQAGKNAVENNLLGGNEETQTKFVQEHGKNIASCSADPSSESCRKGLAMNDALMVALPAGLGGGLLAAATPEIAAAAKVAIQACAGNVVLCLNNAGIQMSEAIVPGGVGAGGAVGIGKTAAEATAAKAEAVAANAVKNSQLPTGTVFDSIKATQPAIPGTSIPKSFELTVNGQTIWVNPNATKHMGEYLTRNGLSHSTSEGSQAMLTSLQDAVKNASSQGIKFNEMMQVGRWELVFSQRPADPYPVLKHALYK
ncbi:TPA: VENN motif pre-toxin domain-containing protein, partial [Serratia marcescens]